ncbi:MAG: hypothetical protein Q8N18_12200 [Opitutaceae bacterium]|nr:hypothetical protein [Opitutaceae bacterium]
MRRALACGLAAAALLLGGCVYLRLLELKLQLDRFDRHFTVQTDEGLTLVCLSPLLRTDDVRWIGLRPEVIRAAGRDEHWHVRWVKELPPAVTEPEAHDLALDLAFADGRLTRIAVPEKYFALMPKEFVTGLIRSLGRGRIDQAGRNLATTVAESDLPTARPRLPAIDRLLGVASERRTTATETTTRYRYRPATTEPGAKVFEMVLHFDPASGELLRWHARTPVGNLSFDFTRRRETK